MTRVVLTRGLALVCGLVVLLTLAGAWANGMAQAKQPDQPTQISAQPQAPILREDVSQRTRNRKVFKHDGTTNIVNGHEVETYTAQVSLGSLHYKDAQGEWQDIDTTPIDDGREYRVDKVNVPVRLPKVGVDPLVIHASEETIAIRLVGASPSRAGLHAAPGATRQNQVNFVDIYPNTDIAYEVEPDAVREYITLKAAGHPNEFTFQVVTRLAMSEERGNIVFRNSAGEVVGQFDRPWVSVPSEAPDIRSGTLRLDDNRVRMILPDLSGLSYPIIVDPSFTEADKGIQNDFDDGYAVTSFNIWYDDEQPNMSFGQGGSGQTFNPALRWDGLSIIPKGTQITAATATFVAYDTRSTTNVKAKIRAAANNDNDRIDSYTEWTSSGAGSTPRTTATVYWTLPSTTMDFPFTTPDISSVLQEAVNHSSFNGVFLLFFDDDGSTAGAFRSVWDRHGNSSKVAKLSITYSAQTVYFSPQFTNQADGTATYYMGSSQAANLLLDYAVDTGSGYGSYTTVNVSAPIYEAPSRECLGVYYYGTIRWSARISSYAQHVKWRVRVPSSSTVKNSACVDISTSHANTIYTAREPSYSTGLDNYALGLGLWP